MTTGTPAARYGLTRVILHAHAKGRRADNY